MKPSQRQNAWIQKHWKLGPSSLWRTGARGPRGHGSMTVSALRMERTAWNGRWGLLAIRRVVNVVAILLIEFAPSLERTTVVYVFVSWIYIQCAIWLSFISFLYSFSIIAKSIIHITIFLDGTFGIQLLVLILWEVMTIQVLVYTCLGGCGSCIVYWWVAMSCAFSEIRQHPKVPFPEQRPVHL